MRRLGGPATAALALAAALSLAAPAVPGTTGTRVQAHAALVASSPAAGTVLEASPPELRLVFSEPLEAELTSVDVVAQDGTEVLSHAGEIDPDDPYALVVAEPNLPEGVYSLTWRTLSAADGHTAEGFFTFGVGDVAELLPPVPVGGMTHTERDTLSVAGRWLTYAGLLLALGMAVFTAVVLGGGPMGRRLVVLLTGGLALTAAATLLMAGRSALESGDPAAYLLGGRNGLLQLARVTVAAGGAIALLIAPARAAAPVAAFAGLAGIGLLVGAGHASALEGPGPLLAGIVHVATVATWAGGLVGLIVLALRPDWLVDGRPPGVGQAVPRFSALALVSIGLAVLTGVYVAWAQTGSVVPADTEYGRTLLLKLVAAAAALVAGAVSYLDGGRAASRIGSLVARLQIELALVGLVLALTAALSLTQPTDGTRGVGIEPIPDAFGQTAPGMRMEIAPGRPGVNRVTVITTDALAAVGGLELTMDRLDTGTSSRVPLTLAGLEGMEGMEGMDHSTMVQRNPDGTVTWYADALVLPADSSWDTSVHVVSEAGTELSRQRFAFALDADGIAEGRVASLLTAGNLLALLLVAGGAIGAGLGLGGGSLPRCEARASRLALTGGGATAVILGLVLGVGGLVA